MTAHIIRVATSARQTVTVLRGYYAAQTFALPGCAWWASLDRSAEERTYTPKDLTRVCQKWIKSLIKFGPCEVSMQILTNKVFTN